MRSTPLIAALGLLCPAHLAAQTFAVEDIAALEARVAFARAAPTGAPGGLARPLDRRLRLAACPGGAEIFAEADAARVRISCAARGWGFAAPLLPTGGQAASRPERAADCRVVQRGDRVTVTVRGAGFAVQGDAVAQDDGCTNAAIRVRYDRTKTSARVRVTGPGSAEADQP